MVRIVYYNGFSEVSPVFGMILLIFLLIMAVPDRLSAQSQSAESEKASYFRQIRPVLQRQCQGCHQPASKQAELLLTSYEGFKNGGKSGAAFVAGKPDQSVVVAYLKGERKPRMPLGGDPLPD